MFPLRDVHRPERAPAITRLILAVLILAFAAQIALAMSGAEGAFLSRWGARPRCVTSPEACGIALGDIQTRPGAVIARWLGPLFSTQFLHGDVLHLALNAWFLIVFGPAVEEKMGRLQYFAFYLAAGIVAALSHVALQPQSNLPLVGASGAIAGILGAHLILMPRSWILSYIPPIWIVPIPSLVFLALWTAGQVAGARALLPEVLGGVAGAGGGERIAWAAHLGGFVFGAACAWRAAPWGKRGEVGRQAPGVK